MKTLLICCIAMAVFCLKAPTVHSFSQLAKLHCSSFDVQLLLRIATGTLSQKYGDKLAEVDCYIRQFVNKDGQQQFVQQDDQDEQDHADQDEDAQEQQVDYIVEQYAQGLFCIQSSNKVQSVYAIWRFIRYLVQNDHSVEWLRARVRACIGYEAERPSAWMDGQQGVDRIRLQKLYSNQFYQYIDGLMFRDFLHPFLTLLRSSTIIAVKKSPKPMLLHSMWMRSVKAKMLVAVRLQIHPLNMFVFTVPGIPLLFSGATQAASWAFSGVLIDRTNVEQIETVNNRFFHYGKEEWVKLDKVSDVIDTYHCTYYHSTYGTLYQKKNNEGKEKEYIVRWHEEEKRVRNVFRDMWELLQRSTGHLTQRNKDPVFPFNSLIIVNGSGIYTLLCFPALASYFIYYDLNQPGEYGKERWIKSTKDHLVVVNHRLSTIKPDSYLREQSQNSYEDAIRSSLKKYPLSGVYELRDLVREYTPNALISQDQFQLRRNLIEIYRKVKYSFLQDEEVRKQCDTLIKVAEQWDGRKEDLGWVVYRLWVHLVKQHSMNHMSVHPTALHLLRFHLLSDRYWNLQTGQWLKYGASYGECDNSEWEVYFKKKLNGTGYNSTCFHVVMMAINETRIILQEYAQSLKDIRPEWFKKKGIIGIQEKIGNVTEEAFGKYYHEAMLLVSQIGGNIIYKEGMYGEEEEVKQEEEEEVIYIDQIVEENDRRGDQQL